MKKRMLLLVLSLILVFSMVLTSCGKDKNTQTGDQSSDTNSQTEDSKSGDDTEPVTLSLFINMDWYWVDSFGGRPVDDEITKKTGVTLDVTKAADQQQQLAVLIGSGDLPDMVYNGTKKLEPELVKHCYSYNELIEKYAPDFEVDPLIVANNTMPDGNFYCIKNNYSTPEEYAEENPRFVATPGASTLHIREDIMEELGNPELNTLEDLEEVLVKVTEKYPDMNALALGPDGYGESYFKMMFGLQSGNNGVYEEDGKIKYMVRDPKYVETYKYLNRLYRKGCIKPESLIYKYEDYQQAITSGNVFAAARAVDESGKANRAFKEADLPYKMTIVNKMLNEEGGTVNDNIGWAGVYITKNCKQPDRAIKFVQFLRSDEGQKLSCWGIEDEHYTLTPEGYPEMTSEMKELYQDYDNMVRTVGNMAWAFGVSEQTEGVWNYTGDETSDWLRTVKESVKEFKPVYNFVVPKEDIDETTIYSKIVDFEKTQTVKLISAETEEEFTAAYNDLVEKLEAMGLSKLEDWMTDKYDEVKDRYE